MRIARRLLLAAIAASSAVSAEADTITGNQFYAWAMSKNDEVLATFYLRGFLDAQLNGAPMKVALFGKDYPVTTVCPPSEVTLGQALDVAKLALAKAPEKRHEPAPNLLRQAFWDVGWKCTY